MEHPGEMGEERRETAETCRIMPGYAVAYRSMTRKKGGCGRPFSISVS